MRVHPEVLHHVERIARIYAADLGWSEDETTDTISLVRSAVSHYPDHRPAANELGVRVYIIIDPRGSLKIGISQNPEGRAYSLNAGNPRGLRVVYQTRTYARAYAMAVEASVHDHLAALALGREWFACTVAKAKEAIHLFGGVGE